ncbi:MAG: hypothetical protein WCD42_14260 [Rhizomicrobium sp.]
METMAVWRLCRELNVVQAALLMVGCDPAGLEMHVEEIAPEARPAGYVAARQAISQALCQHEVDGSWVRQLQYDQNGDYIGVADDSVDLFESKVQVASLRRWLMGRGVSDGFFFPHGADYLDSAHPRYDAALAAAVQNWLAQDTAK